MHPTSSHRGLGLATTLPWLDASRSKVDPYHSSLGICAPLDFLHLAMLLLVQGRSMQQSLRCRPMTRFEWLSNSPSRQINGGLQHLAPLAVSRQRQAVLARSWCVGLSVLYLAPSQSGLRSTDPSEYHVRPIEDLTLGGSN